MAPSVQGPALPTEPSSSSYRSKYCVQHATNQPLDWHIVAQMANQLRDVAVQQLVRNWEKYRSLDAKEALWGDEIEYQLIKLKQGLPVEPLLEQARVLKTLASSGVGQCFQAEYAKFQLESNPAEPYSSKLEDLLKVESDMVERRSLIKQALKDGEAVLTLTASPNLTLDRISVEHIISQAAPAYSLSRKNQLARQGRSWAARIPLFSYHRSTSGPTRLPVKTPETDFGVPTSLEEEIVLDDLTYGVSQCCMQITMQASNLQAARHLYDQFIPLSPVMLALTAATPIYKSRLVDTDARWDAMTQLYDERTTEQLGNGTALRSRWCGNSTYLSSNATDFRATDLPFDSQVLSSLLAAGMDETLAIHYAHVMRWDPIKLMTSDVEDATKSINTTNLFDLFNNSCYQGVRFKPPPGGANLSRAGWRIEFRTMEVQLTDFENAAFAIFIYLVSRVIAEFNLMLYIPIALVHENYERANEVNAVMDKKFWFRTSEWCSSSISENAVNAEAGLDRQLKLPVKKSQEASLYGLITIDEIINGPNQSSFASMYRFPGFIPLIKVYLDRRGVSKRTYQQLLKYLDLVSARANGRQPTAASWMRTFVTEHRDYRGDNVVPETTMFEMLTAIESMSKVVDGKKATA